MFNFVALLMIARRFQKGRLRFSLGRRKPPDQWYDGVNPTEKTFANVFVDEDSQR